MAKFNGKRSKIGPYAYAGVAVLLIAIVVLAYLVINASANPNSNVIRRQQAPSVKNLSNSTMNRTKLILLSDLEKSMSLKSFSISYVSENTSRIIQGQGNFALNVSNTKTINSYHSNDTNVTTYENTTYYKDAYTTQLLSRNMSSIYYYNKAGAQTECMNHTTINTAGVQNTTLDCGHSILGNYYLLQYPYYAKNISKLGILIIEGNITYTGKMTVANRSCDNFIFSNVTGSNLLLNYSVVDLCLDSEYGVPLYIKGTNVVQRVPNESIIWTATGFSTNVPAVDLTVPRQYLEAASPQG